MVCFIRRSVCAMPGGVSKHLILQAEFVALGVLHDDPVLTPFFSRPEVSGAEGGQPISLCIDFLPVSLR